MDAGNLDYDDGEVSIRGHDVYYNASPHANDDNISDDLSDQISIHSSRADHNELGHSHNEVSGSERSFGHTVRVDGLPTDSTGHWHTRSVADSASPSVDDRVSEAEIRTRSLSGDRHNARRDRLRS